VEGLSILTPFAVPRGGSRAHDRRINLRVRFGLLGSRRKGGHGVERYPPSTPERVVSAARPRRPRIVVPQVPAGRVHEVYPVPSVFRPAKDTPPGRSPLLKVFIGLEKTVPFHKYPGDDDAILETARKTWAHIVEGPGWMYVAPRKTPPEVRAGGFRMVESVDDEIVVARAHLVNSPGMDVYLDVIHEFLHILQRKQGRELWTGR